MHSVGFSRAVENYKYFSFRKLSWFGCDWFSSHVRCVSLKYYCFSRFFRVQLIWKVFHLYESAHACSNYNLGCIFLVVWLVRAAYANAYVSLNDYSERMFFRKWHTQMGFHQREFTYVRFIYCINGILICTQYTWTIFQHYSYVYMSLNYRYY